MSTANKLGIRRTVSELHRFLKEQFFESQESFSEGSESFPRWIK
jgi:hypothetical protein